MSPKNIIRIKIASTLQRHLLFRHTSSLVRKQKHNDTSDSQYERTYIQAGLKNSMLHEYLKPSGNGMTRLISDILFA